MTDFHIGVMLAGMVLILVSFLWTFYDRKKSLDDVRKIEGEREELSRIVTDAEIMVEELNRFSDYVVSRVDEKSRETMDIIKNMELKAKEANQGEHESCKSGKDGDKKIEDKAVHILKENLRRRERKRQEKEPDKINNRHKEVIGLAEKGFSETEIAKNGYG